MFLFPLCATKFKGSFEMWLSSFRHASSCCFPVRSFINILILFHILLDECNAESQPGVGFLAESIRDTLLLS